MGRTADVVPNTPILSSWGNEIRDRTVQNFTNAAERAAQWVSPPEGAHSYLRDVDRVEMYNGTAWVPASGNALNYVETTVGQSGIVGTYVDVTGLSLTYTFETTGLYQARYQVAVRKAAGDTQSFVATRLVDPGATTNILILSDTVTAPGDRTIYGERVFTPAAAWTGIKVQINTFAGFVNVIGGGNVYSWLSIERLR